MSKSVNSIFIESILAPPKVESNIHLRPVWIGLFELI